VEANYGWTNLQTTALQSPRLNKATKKKITKIDDRSVLYSFRSLLSPHMGKDNIGAFANPRMNYFKRLK
jgi:hypothetical protein